MMAPTHAALGYAVAKAVGADGFETAVFVIGSIIPDIDHPQSFIGKVFYPISNPIYRRFGHRKLIHSVMIWMPVIFVFALVWKPGIWFGIGAITHCLMDCLNITGVQLFTPLSNKVIVLLNRNLRIPVASRNEFILLCVLMVCGYLAYEMERKGGLKHFVGYMTGSYTIAEQYFKETEDKICYLEGFLRYPNGTIVKDKYLIIGTEGQGLAIWDHRQERVLHLTDDAEFIACWIEKTNKEWNRVRLSSALSCEFRNGQGFMLTKDKSSTSKKLKWELVKNRQNVEGYVNYDVGIVELKPPVEDGILEILKKGETF
jgi:inner membrane protein